MTGKEFLHERKSLGWTQGNVAKVMGCTIRSVRRWEKGEVRVPQSLETIIALRHRSRSWRERAEHYSDQWSAVGTKGQAIIDQLCAENKQAHEALKDLLEAVCGEKGFAEAVRRDSGRIYPWPALELAEAKARKILEQSE